MGMETGNTATSAKGQLYPHFTEHPRAFSASIAVSAAHPAEATIVPSRHVPAQTS